jgi:hypothetical protein
MCRKYLKKNETKTNFTTSSPNLAVKRWQNLETLDQNLKKFPKFM